MPDTHGFNHLGDQVRCIDCPTGGPLGRWPEHKRAQHARTHGRTTSVSRRQRPLLAASPETSNEEREATMATSTSKATSAKQVAIDVLRDAGEPLPAKEIAKRVLASGRCAGLKGKTPEATISAMLAVGCKPGGPFTRVAKGTYTLADAPAADDVKHGEPAAAKRGGTAKSAAGGKAKSARSPRAAGAAKRSR
jgi:HB1, ASXL, restriction endonuclease HTH domain